MKIVNKWMYVELRKLFILFILLVIVFQIAFFKERFLVVLRTVFSIYWVFVLPGFIIMLYWYDKFEFLERLVVGMALSAAIFGVMSYYLNLLEIHVKYYGWIIPLFTLLIGVVFIYLKRK